MLCESGCRAISSVVVCWSDRGGPPLLVVVGVTVGSIGPVLSVVVVAVVVVGVIVIVVKRV